VTDDRISPDPGTVPDDAIVWTPSAAFRDRSRLLNFCRSTGNDTIDDFRRWAADDIGRYWDAVVHDLDLQWSTPYSAPLSLENGIAWPRWFPDGKFNYVANAVDRHATGAGASHTAIIWEGDDGDRRTLTYGDLHDAVNRFANALVRLGVRKGDRVGIFLPMLPETVIATLACGKIGAVYIPLFSGFGADAIASRLVNCDASMLITADAFPRRGTPIPMKGIADEALASVPSVKACVVLRRTGTDVAFMPGRDRWWHEIEAGQSPAAETVETSGSDPYMVIYTSGTTGKPKGTVHSHAGFPIKAAHDLAYCFDLRREDTLFWLTDLGWMMGPWLIAGGLIHGATIMLFEGTPDYPGPDRLWRLVEDHKITHLGIAPTAIRALKPHGVEPVTARDLSSLRVLGSTGETWNPEAWRWFFEVVGKAQLPIINYSGGTETSGGILGCFTSEPIRSCSFAGPIPGMDADVVDEQGRPVRGAVGELIVRQPWVGMTNGFWNDADRYIDTYWSRFPDTWVHGDWTEIDEDGFWYIRGRSDDVLKVSGKRIGPAELESAATAHPAVLESAAIGVPHDLKGETAHVFAVLCPGFEPSRELAAEIRQAVRQHLGPSMQPERVHFVHELPKTRNGKIMRRLIRAAYLGQPTGDATALENASNIEDIARLTDP
jgi:acetyl-CoA synthetase